MHYDILFSLRGLSWNITANSATQHDGEYANNNMRVLIMTEINK